MQQVMFIVLSAVTLISGALVVTTRSLFRSALWLVLTFFGIAGLFVLLNAEFLAVAQVLIYVGAISTLIIFAIMLSRGVMDPIPSASTTSGAWWRASARSCSCCWRPS